MVCTHNNAIVQIDLNGTPPTQLQSKIITMSLNVQILQAFKELCTGGFYRTTVLGGCHETTIVAAGALKYGGVLSVVRHYIFIHKIYGMLIWRDLQVQWATAFSDSLRSVMEALCASHPNKSQEELDLEQTIKWKFLILILLLQKPPSINVTKAKDLKPLIHWQLDQYIAGDWRGLINNSKWDVVRAQALHGDDMRSQSNCDEANIRKAADLLSRF